MTKVVKLNKDNIMDRINVKIGNGYDVHKLAKGLKLVLAGVEIKHTKGLVAHSDGDVVIHALCDALLGALSLGDIGQHFPDTENEYKNIDSRILLSRVMLMVRDRGFNIGNVDITILAQEPKLLMYRELMVGTLSSLMNCRVDQVSVKTTTTEHLGYIGREEGIATYATVLIFK
ncbi:MAG: 2-C-methyl-D-erythritol 2,4-cyclodiphosphate synthase [Bacteroidales bacterium]